MNNADKRSNDVQQNSRLTIGLLIDETDESISWMTLMGVDDVAREQGVNLLCFVGGPLSVPYGFMAQANVLYDLVDSESLDGLVIWGGGLAQYIAPDELEVFCEQYHPIPMVSTALPLNGIPSILVDNYLGMRSAMIHLTQVHGYRRIAFIRGPEGHPEAEDRYRAYTDVLAECGIAFDPNLVAPGIFSELSGLEAIDMLLDQRNLRPRVDFEAIVAVDDVTAFGAMKALRARGIRVPGDVAIVGFDDVEEAEAVTPPLTTMRQPIYEQGRQAAEALLAMLQGEKMPERVMLPTELVVRQSCGCLASSVVRAAAGPVVEMGDAFAVAFAARRDEILSEMVKVMWIPNASIVSEQTEKLLDAFSAELIEEGPAVFLSTLSEILRQMMTMGVDMTLWQEAFSTMRRCTLPCFANMDVLFRAEDLWQQGRMMIGDAVQRGQIYQVLQTEQWDAMLRETGYGLITASTVAELMNEVASGLPQLDIPSCYLSLYEAQDATLEESRLILACDGEHEGCAELEGDGVRFLSRRLVPDGILSQKERYSMIIEPLYFRDEQIGFVLFEMGPRMGRLYETLRGQLSSALRGVLLLQERERAEQGQREALSKALEATRALEKAYAEVERQVEERTSELQRETVERERLQQEVIDAQKQALQDLSTPIIPVMERILVMPLVGSIDSMRARDITRALLAGIRVHRAKILILDITGVPIVDSGVANHLNKTIQAARLKGAHTIITGISDAVAETIVDLGIDWGGVETLANLETGLKVALARMGLRIQRDRKL
ncbi:MAG: substrate-binding domain-containing protein [Chloroflexi bacterium]|nr:substrate-binding domain-containing protein [Chloroflexota bacterium]